MPKGYVIDENSRERTFARCSVRSPLRCNRWQFLFSTRCRTRVIGLGYAGVLVGVTTGDLQANETRASKRARQWWNVAGNCASAACKIRLAWSDDWILAAKTFLLDWSVKAVRHSSRRRVCDVTVTTLPHWQSRYTYLLLAIYLSLNSSSERYEKLRYLNTPEKRENLANRGIIVSNSSQQTSFKIWQSNQRIQQFKQRDRR